GHQKQLMQSFLACCYANRVGPLWSATKQVGATLAIRGERGDEQRRSTIQNGHTEQGVEFWLPIYDWSDERVWSFLREQDAPISPGYRLSPTSLDCMTCTAWLQSGGLGYLREVYPDKHAEVVRRLRVIRSAYRRELKFTDATINGARIEENKREVNHGH
ncbi:MAG TPA: phosphoadenosine phosphosulfate reductase family protein, partial [Phycisphaerales bacterium]